MNKSLSFYKMHGLGNDFMVIDTLQQAIELTPQLIQQWADRHRGIGFDQLLVLTPPPTAAVDFGYLIYNADGSQVAQCGNGARCIARYIRECNLSQKPHFKLATTNRIITLELLSANQVKVNMGIPNFEPSQIPLNLPLNLPPQLDYHLATPWGDIRFAAVSMGNPHCFIRYDDLSQAPVNDLGAWLNQHPIFPEGVNVGFVAIISPQHLKLRVYERGAGETQACGSGACAAAAMAQRLGWVTPTVQVDLPGGSLIIDWPGEQHSLWMTGKAETVYQGQIILSLETDLGQ